MSSDPIVARRLLYAARGIRDFADGYVTILVPIYLLALGFGPREIGILGTVALLGSACFTLGFGHLGARLPPKYLLVFAAMIMTATGLLLASTQRFEFLVIIAFFGTINPAVGNASIFIPLEHAVLTKLSEAHERTRSFSHYSVFGALAAAVGALAVSGSDVLMRIGLSQIAAAQLLFLLYGVLGALVGVLYLLMPVEHQKPTAENPVGLGRSRNVVYRLAFLFSIDAFAGGLAVQSLLFLWLYQRFGLSLQVAAWFFFGAGLLSAFSFPVATWLARHIGLVRTMVYTHIPSSIFLIGAAFSPSLELALFFLLLRAALSQMDIPARASYVMAIVTPPERAAAASLTSVPRSLASAIGPVIAGMLIATHHLTWPLLLCGGLKIAYDFGLLYMFRNVRPPEEVRA